MLVDRYEPEDVFARVPELAGQTDPVREQLHHLLDADPLFQQVKADLGRRSPPSRCHGRHATPVEVMRRRLVIKHLSKWSYPATEQRVAARLVRRWCCRVSLRRVPDAPRLRRWAHTMQPPPLHALHDRVVQRARPARVTHGRTRRLDGTVVQTTRPHPPDSSRLVAGVRVLSRVIRRRNGLGGAQRAGGPDALRTRRRTRRRGLQTLQRPARQQGEKAAAARAAVSKKMIATAEQTLQQAARVRQAREEAGDGARDAGRRLREHRERCVPLARAVLHQARVRVLEGGKVPATAQGVSLCAPHSRVMQRPNGGAPVACGRTVVFDEHGRLR
jgi:IS5 family transposase